MHSLHLAVSLASAHCPSGEPETQFLDIRFSQVKTVICSADQGLDLFEQH